MFNYRVFFTIEDSKKIKAVNIESIQDVEKVKEKYFPLEINVLAVAELKKPASR